MKYNNSIVCGPIHSVLPADFPEVLGPGPRPEQPMTQESLWLSVMR